MRALLCPASLKGVLSAGEAAAYHLKYVAHAITVGEPSGGGAHRIRGVDLVLH